MVVSAWDGVISLWDIATGEKLRIFETFEGHRDTANGMVLTGWQDGCFCITEYDLALGCGNRKKAAHKKAIGISSLG